MQQITLTINREVSKRKATSMATDICKVMMENGWPCWLYPINNDSFKFAYPEGCEAKLNKALQEKCGFNLGLEEVDWDARDREKEEKKKKRSFMERCFGKRL